MARMKFEWIATAISHIIRLLFTVFRSKFNSPQVKWNLISSIINFVYELPHDFLKQDFGL